LNPNAHRNLRRLEMRSLEKQRDALMILIADAREAHAEESLCHYYEDSLKGVISDHVALAKHLSST